MSLRPPFLTHDGRWLVPLTRGYHAVIDAEDAELVAPYTWGVADGPRGKMYAVGWVNGKVRMMHRHLLGDAGRNIRHEDGDGLNNRRSNLRRSAPRPRSTREYGVRTRELIPVGVEALWLVPLSGGYFAVINDCDAERVGAFNWQSHVSRRPDGSIGTVYVRRIAPDGTYVSLHRFVMGDSSSAYIDHRDGDGLNNIRANLRPATAQQNGANAAKPIHGLSSQFKGVVWNKRYGRWRANVKANGVKLHLGYFDNEIEAALAYDAAACAHFGTYARTNIAAGQEVLSAG